MPDYDYRTLSPDDFETFACELLRAHYNVEFKCFRRSPDGGIDLLATTESGRFIVQCKHYFNSRFSDLRRAARAEKQKMDVQQPNQYLFVTTQDLTLTQQLELADDLAPWVDNVNNIVAMRDLNTMLSQHPGVEQANFKLWMASSAVLSQIVQSGLWFRSEALLEEIQDRVQRFVSNDGYSRARAMLDDKHVCVITGTPGVGKSMIADMLSLTHWYDGWQVVTLESHEISRCWDAWNKETKQLFYLDDVFGQTDLQERLGRDSGPHLARLIDRASRAATKRVVVTSRTHILRDAEMRDERIERSRIAARECVVQLSDYSVMQKARILYNHVYFGDLNRDVVREFVQSRRYLQIVRHRNFTPRLIEQSILQHAIDDQSGSLDERLTTVLERPVLLWGNSFRESLDELSRRILMHVAMHQTRGAGIYNLRRAVSDDSTPIAFTNAIKRLEGSWIRVLQEPGDQMPLVRFHDPSCRDFVLAFLDSQPEYIMDLLRRSESIESPTVVLRYALARTSQDSRKYPRIWEAISANLPEIGHLITRAWEQRSKRPGDEEIDDLSYLLSASQHFELGLTQWIVDHALEISLPDEADLSADALDLLSEIGNRESPLRPAETSNLVLIFRAVASALAMEGNSKWTDLNSALASVREELTDEQYRQCYDTIASHFGTWLDGEIDGIVDNATSAQEARDWISEAETEAHRLFGSERFSFEFENFEQKVTEKFEEFDGAGYLAEYGDRSSSGSTSASLLERITEARDAPRIAGPDEAIDSLFRPLQ
ncbi:restriction endonuclease [Pseudonocardia sp. C8]|uniref:restriction endonuclease n=1 Tax=Pseudonocardia sp. C8 TaxID=2762759 RepID=UPI001642B05D|nr:restriction endonuclease [Pseudonocardia sp. C8]MBC3191463.1 restriction endonuclease [Pseudonocardia sp. C8]